jgi:hypothetical protein
MNYIPHIIEMTFRAQHPDDLQPTPQDLDDFDTALFDVFDAEVQTQAADPANNIPNTLFNRSILVFFAVCSKAKLTKTRVRHACTYFLAVQPTP